MIINYLEYSYKTVHQPVYVKRHVTGIQQQFYNVSNFILIIHTREMLVYNVSTGIHNPGEHGSWGGSYV